MTLFVLSQILVGLAIGTDLLSFQFKERQKVIACLLVSCTLISLHFALLEIWTAAGLGVIAGARFITCYFSTSKKLMAFFLLLGLINCFFTFSGYLTLLSGAAAVFNTIGSFCSNDKKMREFIFLGTSFWLVHNILAGSPTAVLLEAVFLCSNLLGYYRYYVKGYYKTQFFHS